MPHLELGVANAGPLRRTGVAFVHPSLEIEKKEREEREEREETVTAVLVLLATGGLADKLQRGQQNRTRETDSCGDCSL
jgi:hypothetical protein